MSHIISIFRDLNNEFPNMEIDYSYIYFKDKNK